MKNTLSAILILTAFLAQSCGLFEPRDPESPDSGGSNNAPPTSPEVVVENFKSAIAEKNIDNYAFCFSAEEEPGAAFEFVPSPLAQTSYASIFDDWDYAAERAAFNRIVSEIAETDAPRLNLSGAKFELIRADSALYLSEYELSVVSKIDMRERKYAGKFYMTIKRLESGFWHIQSWTDDDAQSDSAKPSWSFLKAESYD